MQDQRRRELAGKVAIVTGAGRGIGAATARALGEAGASVVVNYASSKDTAMQVVQDIQAAGAQAHSVELSLSDAADARRLFDEAIDQFGRVDVLVLNASIARFAPISTFSEEEFDRAFAANAKAPFFAIQQAAERMSEGGRVISISAALTRVGYDNTALYAGTKGALEQFTLAAAKELGKRHITCNCVSPGATDTDLYRSVSSEAGREVARQRTPFKRLGEAREIADVVCFLASDRASWVSGQNIVVNGAALW
ncbi:MAG TPA: SDR family oxidoreductase [Ramlibacter sp.]|nr:SDR family oxidoreductase [Ramlibacter sp.]